MRLARGLAATLALLASVALPAGARGGYRHFLPPLWVTGYDLTGITATGALARWGVCATDPRFIPLGSWVSIPGIGTCHAEDTGSGIYGYHVDVWRSSAAQCYAITGLYRHAYWR